MAIGLQPAIVRVTAPRGVSRRALLAAARGFRLRLADRRRGAWRLWGWTALTLWMTSPLQLFLCRIDPAAPAAAQDATPLYRYLRYGCALIPLAALLRARGTTLRLGLAAWPLLALLADATASWTWSQDRTAWLHGALAGAPTWLLAAALAVSLRPGRAAQALLQVLAVSSLASVLAVLLIPHWAVAGPQDVLGASAPGDWRGLYGHKNTLGHVAGLAAAALCARGGRLVRPRWLRWAGLASAVACVLASRSISGMALAAGLPLLDRLLRSGGLVRACAAAFATAALAALFAARALVLSAGLAALGRDATLSGRTAIWRAAGELIGHRPLAGWGLDYSVSTGVQTRLTALFGVNHVHNAMLDVFINLGAVGLLLAAAAVLGALWTGSDGSQRVPRSDVAAAAALRLLVLGWLLSGVSEDMAVRADGPMAQIGLCALFALYRLGAGRGSFRRPRFSFRPAWRAPLRPPRLPAAPCG